MKNNEIREIKDVASRISDWVSSVLEDTDTLSQIPISKADTPLKFNVSVSYLVSTLGISENSAYKHRDLLSPVIHKMIDEKILVITDDKNTIAGIEASRKLRNWYQGLTLEDKKKLPIFGNKISLGKIPKEQCPITRHHLSFSNVKEAWNEIHQDLEEKEIVKADYKTVAQRNNEKLIRRETQKEFHKDRFNKLATLKLTNITDFKKISESDPFIQVRQLFASRSNSVPSKSAKEEYLSAYNYFNKFLTSLYGNKPLSIVDTFDEHLLSRFRKYLEDKTINEGLKSSTVNSYLSRARQALKRLKEVQDIEYNFFDVISFDTYRQTDAKKPLKQTERLKVFEATDKGIAESKLLLEPYKKTGIGINPLDQYGNRIRGLSTLDNARWLFENSLNCKPVYYNTAKTRIEKAFLKIIQDAGIGLDNVYREWGVMPMIGIDILLPYLLKLAQVTGMNTKSLLALDIDDFSLKHPATKRPCLRYWKERSNGEKEFHLDLIKSDLTWITLDHTQVVENIFDDVIKLTSNFRDNITSNTFKKRLFIYQSNSTKAHQRVSPLLGPNDENYKALGLSIAQFIEKYQLKNDKGQPLTLTISRFRPTFVSEQIKAHADMRVIQIMLGHSSLRTTYKYIDSYDFNLISRKQLDKTMTEMHQSTLQEQPEENPQKIEVKDKDEPIVTFRTPLADCKNIFDPPDFVKKLATYVPGTPCSQYNKCLRCDNVVISAHHLPQLFAMQRDYKALLENTLIMETPYGHLIQENLELLNQIIDPNQSDFSKLELENAKIASEYIEDTLLIDGVI